ncbi:MAG: triose-phosphate isomerase [Patescibacteria group bacterium]
MKKLIIANWKMQLSYQASLALARAYVRRIKTDNTVVVAPDHLVLPAVAQVVRKSGLALGAQDSAGSAAGAYTGEVSPLNLKACGVKYVILGHSERRAHLHENASLINTKLKAALAQGLIPVLCVGEKLAERQAGRTKQYLASELRRALKDIKIKDINSLIIAYEPVWAISTNKNARPLSVPEASAVHSFLKVRAAAILKKQVRVLYGGSVNAENAAAFLAGKDINGLLVGGASLKLKDFISICS